MSGGDRCLLTLSGIPGHQRRSWGIFNFTKDGVMVFFHQPLPSENKTKTQTIGLWGREKYIYVNTGLRGGRKRNRILQGNNLSSLECPQDLGTILCVAERLGSPQGEMKWEMKIMNHPDLLHVTKTRKCESE